MDKKSLFYGLFLGAIIAIFVVHAITFYKIKKVVLQDHSYTVQMWNVLTSQQKSTVSSK